MTKKLIIIGSGAAGLPIASAVRAKSEIDITVVTESNVIAYSPCGMTFVLEGKIPSFNDLIMQTPAQYQQMGINILTETKVKKININKQIVFTNKEELHYDYLVIATGYKPFIPQIKGVDLEGVFTLKTIEDGIKIQDAMKNAENVVVVGAGAVGLEAASAFVRNGLKTTVVEMLPWVLPQILDKDMAVIVQKHLEKMGVNVITNQQLSSINGKNSVENVNVGNKKIKADLVLMATGITPNVSLAKEAGIKIGELGGIVTDCSLRVGKGKGFLDNVYAAGNCAEIINKITKKPALSVLGTTASRQAMVVGNNIIGDNMTLDSLILPNICVIGDLQVGSVGITTQTAHKNGIKPRVAMCEGCTRARYYPGNQKIYTKLLEDTMFKIIGAQIISKEGVKQRIDALSFAIEGGLSAYVLARAETCYAPPVSPYIDPTTITARIMIKGKYW